MQGFLNLNKPTEFTSHDCVAKVRKLLRLKRVGHGGTLDPAATGVLPIALGKATRLLQYLRTDKAYWGTIRLGVRTTTDDLEGEIISAEPVRELTVELVKAALGQFVGKIQQIPPSYSAIQIDGKRLYDLARTGEIIDVPARQVEVYKIEILEWREGDFPELDVAIACGAGTYIRAIARDLGTSLNIGGTLAALTRTSSSGFNLTDSLTFEELEAQLKLEAFNPIPAVAALSHLSTLTLTAKDAKAWCQGQRVFPPDAPIGDGEPLRVHDEDGRFLGIGCLGATDAGYLLVSQMVFEPIS